MTVYQHKYMDLVVDKDKSIVYFNWKPATAEMSENDFEWTILRYASFVKEYNAKNVVINGNGFKARPTEAGMHFVATIIRDCYNSAGVVNKIFLADGAPFKETKEEGANYTTYTVGSMETVEKLVAETMVAN